MPTYTFRNTDTNEEWTELMSIAEREEYLKNNKNVIQLLSAVPLADPTRLGLYKPDNGFRDVLRHVKKHHPLSKGINTF